MTSKTLQEYFSNALANSQIDHALRVLTEKAEDGALFYIHPANSDGETLQLVVKGNSVSLAADNGGQSAQYGGPELLQQARDLCQALEKLPPGLDQTKLISLVSDATFGLYRLQTTGEHFWPRPVAPTEHMTFGQAIEALRAGNRVARAGWNGKGMFLVLDPGSVVNELREGSAYHKAGITINPHIDMKTATGEMQPGWLASQTDMLADDWQVVSASTGIAQ